MDQQQQVDGAPIPVPNVQPNALPNAQPNNNVNAVRIRVPPFWKNDPQLWFLQLEAQFALSNIVSDLTKFNTVVGNVEPSFLDPVKDIIRNPPANNRYETIKTRLTKKFEESDNSKIKILLNELTLGDLKPSELLHKMQDLSCGKVGNDLLQILWLQRLPINIQSVLACSNDPLATLSTMADKIFETSSNTTINSIADSSNSNSDLVNMIYNIEDKINSLNKKIDMSGPRNRSKSPKRYFKNTSTSTNDVCWLHETHGHKAIKQCHPPCAFAKQSKNESGSQKRRLTPTRP